MSPASPEKQEETNPSNKKAWSSFLKSAASFSGDLSSLSAPPFILSTTSLVEYSSYWADRPSIFVAPAAEPDPAKRAALVLTWFLSTLKQRTAGGRSKSSSSEKKPLNPFLGELFLGKWEDGVGTTHLVSEQVSHHPPATAFSIWNNEHGVRLQGYNAPKTSFSYTVHISQNGHALLHIDKYDEDYLITLPPLRIEGLMAGAPFIELSKTSYIQSSSGFTAKIDYSGKGWLSGRKNVFKATLYPESNEKDILYTVEGQWSSTFTLRDAKTNTDVQTYNTPSQQTTPLTTTPEANQDPLESHKAWRPVANAIQTGNLERTSAEKSKIEDQQRHLRRREQAEGRTWQSRYFQPVARAPVFEALKAKLLQECRELQDPGPIWRWDERKAAAAAAGAPGAQDGANAEVEAKTHTAEAEAAPPPPDASSSEEEEEEGRKEEKANQPVEGGPRSVQDDEDTAEAVRVGMPYTSHIVRDV